MLELEQASSLIAYLGEHSIEVRHHIADLTYDFSGHLQTGDDVPEVITKRTT